MVSCRTTRETVKNDVQVEMSKHSDFKSENVESYDEICITEIQKNVYDSVITHITIYRYDTILLDGSPIIKEKIEVEQVKTSGDNSTCQIRDSIKACDVEKTNVTYNDTITILKHEQTQTKKVEGRNKVVEFVLLLFLVCLAYIIIRIWER